MSIATNDRLKRDVKRGIIDFAVVDNVTSNLEGVVCERFSFQQCLIARLDSKYAPFLKARDFRALLKTKPPIAIPPGLTLLFSDFAIKQKSRYFKLSRQVSEIVVHAQVCGGSSLGITVPQLLPEGQFDQSCCLPLDDMIDRQFGVMTPTSKSGWAEINEAALKELTRIAIQRLRDLAKRDEFRGLQMNRTAFHVFSAEGSQIWIKGRFTMAFTGDHRLAGTYRMERIVGDSKHLLSAVLASEVGEHQSSVVGTIEQVADASSHIVVRAIKGVPSAEAFAANFYADTRADVEKGTVLGS